MARIKVVNVMNLKSSRLKPLVVVVVKGGVKEVVGGGVALVVVPGGARSRHLSSHCVHFFLSPVPNFLKVFCLNNQIGEGERDRGTWTFESKSSVSSGSTVK